MTRKIPLLVVCGPTASGKSNFAVEAAMRLGGEILSADSMQIYRGLDAGTAKPTEDQRRQIRHHMIDCIDPRENFNVSRYVEMSDQIIRKVHGRKNVPLVAGGTGLYIESLLYGLFESPPSDETLRTELDRLSSLELRGMLSSVDPKAADKIPLGNRRRMIRALEVYRLTGLPFSLHHQEERVERYPALIVGLSVERQELYNRINRRVDQMVADGLFKEVEELLAGGISPTSTAFQGIGYRQALGFFQKKYDRDEAICLIKRDTRRYAKRQMTWFRNRLKAAEWVPPKETECAVTRFLEFRSRITD